MLQVVLAGRAKPLVRLVGKFHPFLGEHAPCDFADLIHRRGQAVAR
jgi:hypothetical protein